MYKQVAYKGPVYSSSMYYIITTPISHQLFFCLLGVIQDGLPRHLLSYRFHPSEIHGCDALRCASQNKLGLLLLHLVPVVRSFANMLSSKQMFDKFKIEKGIGV